MVTATATVTVIISSTFCAAARDIFGKESSQFVVPAGEEEMNDHPTVSKVYRRNLRGMVCTDVVREGKNTARFLEKFLDRFESKLSSLSSTNSDRDYSRRYARRERKNEKKKLLKE